MRDVKSLKGLGVCKMYGLGFGDVQGLDDFGMLRVKGSGFRVGIRVGGLDSRVQG